MNKGFVQKRFSFLPVLDDNISDECVNLTRVHYYIGMGVGVFLCFFLCGS